MNPDTPKYTTTDIAKLGVKRERIKDWIDRGFISPSIPAQGKGTKHLFSTWDLYKILLFQNLVQSGTSRENAVGLLGRLSKDLLNGNVDSDWIALFIAADGECQEIRIWVSHDSGKKISFHLNNFPTDFITDIRLINFRALRCHVKSAVG